jgi:Tfp pilus assembly protein PilN
MAEQEVLKMAITQGIWAVLFVALLFYVLRTQEKREAHSAEREDKLMEHLDHLTTAFDDMKEVKSDLKEVKQDIKVLKDRRAI